MPTSRLKLDRRALLKGLGGAAIGLPLLEAMVDADPALAQTPPKRYVVCFGGQSMGADNDPLHDDYVPTKVGAGYDLKTALAPLAAVQSEVSVISGLRIPTAADNGGTVPAGGRRDDFHVSSLSPLLSGVRAGTSTASMGPTSDQLVANAISGPVPFKSLVYRVQAAWYLSVSAPYGRDIISYKADAQGRPVPIPATVSPKQAFDALFGNFTPPATDADAARKAFELRKRKSVLDLVRGDTERLLPKLGRADQARLSRHLEEIRELERRIAAIPPPATGVCQKPMDPGADPALGGAQGTDVDGNNTYDQNLGYSNEEQRAQVFVELIHLAFACDLARVASLQFTMFQSHMNMYPLTGQRNDLHELGHAGFGTVGMAKAQAWHMKHFAALISRLRDAKLLDTTALVFLHEGGHGFDASSGKQYSSHSTENMACLVAGGAGGLKGGLHLPAPGRHPASVLLTAMNAVGVGASALGEVTGEIPGLRG